MRVRQIQVAHRHADGFTRPGAGVVQEEQDRVVAETLTSAESRGVEQRVHLMFLEVAHAFVGRLLERDTADFIAPREVLGAAGADEARERVERGQALIACRDPTGSRLFEMAQKLTDVIGRQITEAQPVHRRLRRRGDKRDQQG